MDPDMHLTPEEASLVENPDWLIAKQRIIGKVYGLFGKLSEQYAVMLDGSKQSLPQEINSISPKIYKGEMYRQLPYVMLDHPRLFNKADAFAIRSFFWWGNHFSIHLLLAGKYRTSYFNPILKHLATGDFADWYVGSSDDPWQHHFEPDNYLPVQKINNLEQHFQKIPYLKLAKFHPLEKWQESFAFFKLSYEKILNTIDV